MEIHDLNTKALTDPAYVAFDDGTDTYKTEFNECVENAANAAVAAADLTDNEVAFTSGDAASPTAWSSVSVLTSGSTLATLFNRISTMIKNVRWLYSKLGTTDISSIGNGTVTGALSTLNGNLTIEPFTLSISDTITDAYIRMNYGFYIPALKIGVIKLFITSNNGLIPIRNETIATIPDGFRPTQQKDIGYAIVTSTSTSGWQPANYEILSLTSAGQVRLGNYIHGVPIKSIAIDIIYSK